MQITNRGSSVFYWLMHFAERFGEILVAVAVAIVGIVSWIVKKAKENRKRLRELDTRIEKLENRQDNITSDLVVLVTETREDHEAIITAANDISWIRRQIEGFKFEEDN